MVANNNDEAYWRTMPHAETVEVVPAGSLAACKRELEEAERVTDSLDESFERHVEAYEALEAALKAEQEKSERLRGAITDSLDPRNYPRILAALNTSSEPPDQSP